MARTSLLYRDCSAANTTGNWSLQQTYCLPSAVEQKWAVELYYRAEESTVQAEGFEFPTMISATNLKSFSQIGTLLPLFHSNGIKQKVVKLFLTISSCTYKIWLTEYMKTHGKECTKIWITPKIEKERENSLL